MPPPTDSLRLLVLRHGPSARLQGVAIVAGYEPPVQSSAYGLRDPRFDFCRHNPRFCRTPLRRSLALACPADLWTLYQQDRNPHCDCPYPQHQHALRYGGSGQAPIYLASHTYGHCRKSRTCLCEAGSQRLQLFAEHIATEFTERPYIQSTPVYRSYRNTQHPHSSPGRTCMHSVSAIAVEHLLLS